MPDTVHSISSALSHGFILETLIKFVLYARGLHHTAHNFTDAPVFAPQVCPSIAPQTGQLKQQKIIASQGVIKVSMGLVPLEGFKENSAPGLSPSIW